MAASKTFANNEVLTASDLNTYVNPSTAAHVPYAVAADVETVTIPAGQSSASVAVTFPSGRFTETPIINITPHSSAAPVVSFGNPSATGMTLVGRRPAGASTSSAWTFTAHWIAVQMSPTSAAG